MTWPELASALRDHGARSYSIFLDAARSVLFDYVELESLERWNALSATEVCRRWWVFMRDLMETYADSNPVTEDLAEVFHTSTWNEVAGTLEGGREKWKYRAEQWVGSFERKQVITCTPYTRLTTGSRRPKRERVRTRGIAPPR